MNNGPFGISQSMTLADVLSLGAVEIEGQPFTYHLVNVPKSHPQFESYVVSIGRNSVAGIRALGRDISTNVYGEAVLGAFDEMDAALQRKYGERERFDFLRIGSVWDEPKDWTTALLKGERTLAAFWNETAGSVLTEEMQGIALTTHMHNDGSGYLELRYDFSNFVDFEAAVSRAQDDAL